MPNQDLDDSGNHAARSGDGIGREYIKDESL
jgi:hypothetical protein